MSGDDPPAIGGRDALRIPQVIEEQQPAHPRHQQERDEGGREQHAVGRFGFWVQVGHGAMVLLTLMIVNMD
jgi:hypothetical protein